MFVDGITQYIIDEEHAILIQDVLYKFFKSFGPESMNTSIFDRIREERIKLFNATEDDRTKDGYIKIKVLCDGRITNLQPL